MKTVYLTLSDFEIICRELLRFFKSKNEPYPAFEDSYFDKLDSVIATPKRTFSKKDLYPNLYAKAACYFYFINKFHPFSNGNKRISIVSTGVFLMYNGYEFTADENTMYTFAKKITLSKKHQEKEFSEVILFMKEHSKKLSGRPGHKFISDLIRLLQDRLKNIPKIKRS